MNNLHLTTSSADTAALCLLQAPEIHSFPSVVYLDTQDHPGGIRVVAGKDVADRIVACVNTCNDLATETLTSVEVRQVIAELVRQNESLLVLLKKLTDNACKIEHDSYLLQGHEDFNVGAVVGAAKEVLAAVEAAKAVAA